MKISFCIPCMNRAHDLRRTLPHLLAAAKASPPVEIIVVDYNSKDDLQELVNQVDEVTCHHYTATDYYHIAHAYNLAVKVSTGNYVTIMGADAVLNKQYVVEARKLIADGCIWMRGRHYKGILMCQRREFLLAGGFDERFEFYSGEDKDLELRLKRRGSKFGLIPDGLIRTLRTSNVDKVANYRLKLSKKEMMQLGTTIRKENIQNEVLIANQGIEWGQWNGPLQS